MTNRERLVKTLLCQKTDRPPFSMWLGFAPWWETLQRWRRESGITDLDVGTYFGFEPFFSVVPMEYGPLPHFEEKKLEENESFVVTVDWRGIVMRNRLETAPRPDSQRQARA